MNFAVVQSSPSTNADNFSVGPWSSTRDYRAASWTSMYGSL